MSYNLFSNSISFSFKIAATERESVILPEETIWYAFWRGIFWISSFSVSSGDAFPRVRFWARYMIASSLETELERCIFWILVHFWAVSPVSSRSSLLADFRGEMAKLPPPSGISQEY